MAGSSYRPDSERLERRCFQSCAKDEDFGWVANSWNALQSSDKSSLIFFGAEFEGNITDTLQPSTETAPRQIHAHFFTPENKRNRLTTRTYSEKNNLHLTCGVANTHLVDCIAQPLKCVHNFRQAAELMLQNDFAECLKSYAAITSGDWPAQIYNRQIAYNKQFQPQSLRNIVPSMGPLQISLDGQELVVPKHIAFSSVSTWLYSARSLPISQGPGE